MKQLPQSPTALRWEDLSTEGKNQALRVLAQQGLSAGEIAQVLGVSRNKVVGQCWRWDIKLGRDDRASRFRSKTSGQRTAPGAQAVFKSRRKKHGVPPIQDNSPDQHGADSPMWVPLEGRPPLPLDELPLRGRCRWPVHPRGVAGHFCCGAPTEGKPSFCPTHHARAFRGVVDWERELEPGVTDA
jgi:hypothetical protein